MTSHEDRVAILLNVLGSELAQPVMAHLSAEKKQRLRLNQQEFSQLTLADPRVGEVLADFEKFASRSRPRREPMLRIAQGTVKSTPAELSNAAVSSVELSGEELRIELQNLEPFQIAGAVAGENPQTIALVLNCLGAAKVAQTLYLVAEEIRSDVFVRLSQQPVGSQELMKRIIAATVEKGRKLIREVPTGDSGSDQRVADLLRAMPRDGRTLMLAALIEKSPESAERVKALLFVFEDLLLIENRSLQKLLGEVESGTLAVALKDADEMLREKVMSNISQRAQASLSEEMDLLGTVNSEKREAAQHTIVEVIARMDGTGELVMLES